jgi:uncharacterized protein YbjT (DUF2867 family)
MTWLFVFVLYAIALSIALGRAGVRSQPVAGGDGAGAAPPTRILVIGATGGTGRQLVAQALEQGHLVTALVRSPGKLGLEHQRLTVVAGDVLDARAVEEVMRGQDAVLCALGHKRYFMPTRILSDGTQNILRAMQAHGVRRLVCETSLGIGNSAGRMGLYYTLFVIPVILAFYFWDKTRQERLIAASGLEWVIVRPGALTNAAGRGHCREGQDIGSLVRTVRISRADVAGFMLGQLASDRYLRSAVGVCW